MHIGLAKYIGALFCWFPKCHNARRRCRPLQRAGQCLGEFLRWPEGQEYVAPDDWGRPKGGNPVSYGGKKSARGSTIFMIIKVVKGIHFSKLNAQAYDIKCVNRCGAK